MTATMTDSSTGTDESDDDQGRFERYSWWGRPLWDILDRLTWCTCGYGRGVADCLLW